MQVAFAFRHIEGALNYLVDNLDKFSGLAAESERLEALLTGRYPTAQKWSEEIDTCLLSNMVTVPIQQPDLPS